MLRNMAAPLFVLSSTSYSISYCITIVSRSLINHARMSRCHPTPLRMTHDGDSYYESPILIANHQLVSLRYINCVLAPLLYSLFFSLYATSCILLYTIYLVLHYLCLLAAVCCLLSAVRGIPNC